MKMSCLYYQVLILQLIYFRFSLQEFVYLSREELLSLQKLPLSLLSKGITDLSKSNPTTTRLVPNMKGNVLRIKLVDSFEGLDGHLVKFRDWKYLMGSEPKSLSSCPGVLVSSWWKCPSLTNPRISYKECRHWINCYGKGFGSRQSASCVGLNVYTDDEGILSHRPHPDVWTDENEIHLQQYCNKNFEFPLMRSLLEKRLHVLTKKAREKAYAVHGDLMQLIDGSCTKRIVTTGSAVRQHGKPSNQWGPHYFYSFTNQVHVDNCDLMTRRVIDFLVKRADNDYKKRIVEFPKVCLPTTCAYQFCWRSKSDESKYVLRQFFLMDGLGLAMPLEDGIAHHFMASLFAHNTSTAVLEHPKGGMSLGESDPVVLIFAWGNSGNSKNTIARHGSSVVGVPTRAPLVMASPRQEEDAVAVVAEQSTPAVTGKDDEASTNDDPEIGGLARGLEEEVVEEFGPFSDDDEIDFTPVTPFATTASVVDDPFEYPSSGEDGVGDVQRVEFIRNNNGGCFEDSDSGGASTANLPLPEPTDMIGRFPVSIGFTDRRLHDTAVGGRQQNAVNLSVPEVARMPDRNRVAKRQVLQGPDGGDLEKIGKSSGIDIQRRVRIRKRSSRRRLQSTSEKYRSNKKRR